MMPDVPAALDDTHRHLSHLMDAASASIDASTDEQRAELVVIFKLATQMQERLTEFSAKYRSPRRGQA
jgi:hypothetical protein